jgi:catechol 2,3-dioxygenase-like lactoylglutathione lyase family enzyme
MGMYDEIKVHKLYCYHCGAALVDNFWQSKSGECVLKRYDSLEEFGAEFYKLASFQLGKICPECEEFLELELRNPSEEHRVYLAESDKEWRARLIEEQSAKHPDHNFGGYSGTGEVFYTNTWCRVCQEKGYSKGRENSEMSSEHIAAGKIWASQHIDEKHRNRRKASFLGIDAIGICVRDLVTSTAFYEKLGFVKEKETGRDCVMSATGRFFFTNPRLLLFQTDNVAASGSGRRFDLLDNPPGFDHVRFLADDIDTLCGDLKTKGIIVEGPLVAEQESLRIARLRDPDGNNLVFIEEDEKK